MKIGKALTFTCFFLVTITSAFATIPTFFFDNQEGFVNADQCSISQIESQRFRISTYTGKLQGAKLENLRNHKGIKQSHLVNGSLVKLIEGKSKRDYKKTEIVGINQGVEVQKNRWFSERLDRGYLYYRSLLPAEDYVLKIEKGTENYSLGDIKSTVEGLYLRLAMDDHFFKLNCPLFGNREYVIFKIYEKYGIKPLALVGMYWDESKIFKYISSMTKYEGVKILPNLLSEEYLGDDMRLTKFDSRIDDSSSVAIENDINQEAISTNIGIDNVVCVSTEHLNVRNTKLDKVVFTAKLGEKIKVFQGWGEHTQSKLINGEQHIFRKVQFSERESEDQVIGWIASAFIKTKEKCKYINLRPKGDIDQISETTITGLDDPNCCEFPTVKRPSHRYDSGMRRFDAGRSGGKRLHAACDLYRYKDEPILSVAPGKIIRNRYYFYQGTYALEVKHSGGFVVRYGELDKKAISGMSKGKELKMGERIGYMGKVNSDCCRPMLHFELFDGSKTGSLSQSGNRYQRRSDLINPTTYLLKWENENF
ncbi:MAG: peptidoglycan DD-metalloendopeptidase family protein [Bacteriovoracaceae bacterium]|jgi:murein DD-endopeptidase MepM/ murein hydrolase activator NlpD|nr:peptidoglycan DD-metalloendopeptidase family protein [Bacteriovoracaceae bacterium]